MRSQQNKLDNDTLNLYHHPMLNLLRKPARSKGIRVWQNGMLLLRAGLGKETQ